MQSRLSDEIENWIFFFLNKRVRLEFIKEGEVDRASNISDKRVTTPHLFPNSRPILLSSTSWTYLPNQKKKKFSNTKKMRSLTRHEYVHYK